MSARIQIDPERVADFCRRHKVDRLALFGSVLRDDFTPDSDVDVLVDFAPEARAGLFEMARMEAELEELIGRKVDLRTPAELSRFFRDEVVASAEVQYAREDYLDEVDALAEMPDEERARLHESLRQSEAEIAAGKSIAAEDLLRELRAARRR
jgi:predicted nucleotidyltransferase